MTIDWGIVLAQAANFLVLVWLLKRFLYEPVRRTMNERDARIADTMREAEAEREAARAEALRYRTFSAELEAERAKLLDDAMAEAQRGKRALMEAAAHEVDEARREMYRLLETERAELRDSIQERLAAQVCDTVGRVVFDLSDLHLADAVIERAARAARHEDGVMSDGPVHVRTSFLPTPEQKERLRAVAVRLAGGDATRAVTFAHDPSLLLGVEFVGGGHSLGWCARDFVGAIEERALAGLAPEARVSREGSDVA